MSKAFTREEDNLSGFEDNDVLTSAYSDDADGDDLDADKDTPPGGRNYITPAGAQKWRDELRQILHEERPQVVEAVTWAAANGDRSENADYIYGKKRLREIDRRLRFLQRQLDSAIIVDPAQQKSDQVLFGATVKVRDLADQEKSFQIVGIHETDARRGLISWVSPIGKALLQSKVGDVVVYQTPKGEEELEILEIQYR